MRLTIDLSRSRVETKYGLAAEDVPALTSRIPSDGREEYGVVTLYFDRRDGSLARQAIDHPLRCTKVRTRQYPGDRSVWFEVKTRRGCWTRKSRLRLSLEEAAHLVRGLSPRETGEFAPLLSGNGDDAEARARLRELAEGRLAPVGAVYAWRKTFLVSRDQVRITLDQGITYFRPSLDPYSIPGSTAPGLRLHQEPALVLEVKHGGALPAWGEELVAGLTRSKYSKFRNLVLSLQEHGRSADRVDRF